MAPGKLQRGEYIAMVGGALLAVSLFLTWYATKGNGRIDGTAGDFTAWDVHTILRWLFLFAALAPFVLSYIIARNISLSWPRGEVTAVVAIFAFGFLLYNGLLQRPGTSNSLSSLQLGWFLAVLGTVLMMGGAAVRSSAVERKRKPPGTL